VVFGPNYNTANFSSGDIIKKFVSGEIPMYPKSSIPVVDVRDVAKAHLQAILVPEAANKRFILCNKFIWFGDIAKILNDSHGKTYPKIPKREAPKCLICLLACFKSELRTTLNSWGKMSEADNTPTKKILGIEFIDTETTINDMVPTLVETGYIS